MTIQHLGMHLKFTINSAIYLSVANMLSICYELSSTHLVAAGIHHLD
jgi:hypothetical protein